MPDGDADPGICGGLRRRHSSQHDEDDVLPSGQGEARTNTYELSSNSHSFVSKPNNRVIPSSAFGTANDGSRPIPTTVASSPKVRFSTDNERVSTTDKFEDGVDDDGKPTCLQQSLGQRKRSSVPSLSIESRAGHGSSDTVVSAQSMERYPPKVSSNRSAPPLRSSVSPIGRSRGYSLRSSLFRRTIEDHAGVPGPAVELQTASSSNYVPQRFTETGHGSGKKSTGATVTISPAFDEAFELSPHKAKGVRGISALPNYESWMQQRARRNRFIRNIRALYHRARKTVLRINELPPSKDGRHIDLDVFRKEPLTDERTGRCYVGNTIRSSRYTAWNFVPRQLFAQFSKLANFYFLCVSILQMIPNLSTTGTYTTIVPLLFFVSISMAKEGYDDLRRYRLDKAENNQEGDVLRAYQPTFANTIEENVASLKATGLIQWATTKWKDIQVGDIAKLRRDEAAPADMVLLRSTSDNGIAYFETMALDGETNLKRKQTAAPLAQSCKDLEDFAECKIHFVVEDPNLDLYNFEGRVTVAGETSPLTNAQIVYRGSILRNTSEAIGMIVYTGEECKIRMNANKNPYIKAPSLQTVVNRIVVIIVVFVIALAIFNTVAYQIWSKRTEDKAWYLANAGVAFFPILVSFIIMFNTMIPLSLYVSLEIIKIAQMFLLNDIDMYDEVSNTPFEARTSTINEELGQVSYVFSDKTGTLTDNSMKLRKMSVAGTAWLHDADLNEASTEQRLVHKKRNKGKGKRPLGKSRTSETFSSRKSGLHDSNDDGPNESENGSAAQPRWHSSARPAKSQLELRTIDMIRYIQKKPFTVFARKARLFLLGIALCHTCLSEVRENGDIDFQASSPDELALVSAAQELGYLAINRDVRTLTLKRMTPGSSLDPIMETYEVLDVIEFSSKRKRMSIVVRFPDQRICIFCKGADSVVMQHLKLSTLASQKVAEIEHRASKRKSLEAQYAIQRKSEQIERKNSIHRPSLTLARVSIGGPSRPSMSGQNLQPIRDELDGWLREREREIDVSSEDYGVYYSPRPSAQLGRHSLAPSEARSSMQTDEEDDLVDEALVVDEPAVFERCFQHINDFATEGLRTLLYAYRFLGEQEYSSWKKIYLDATTSLIDRQTMTEEAGEIIERDLELAGATAIEDKLQNGVPEAIDKLRRASIKMWMLTGDKRETAINIGHSCRLIKDYSSVTVLDHESGDVEQHIAAAIIDINSGEVAHSVVVVDGQTLSMIEAGPSIQSLFHDLAILADSVVCCRASPSQKAGLVKSVRKKVKKSITLAIGDGANDIAMIQEAHVGIGITGKEGLQAARTSDYSIAQFRFLTKLLLVHGRWNYTRTCKYTVGTFWKEMLFYLTQALYQRWAGYTGTSLYESWSLSMFNTLFTSLPVIFMGVFEKDLAASTLIAVPELYTKGQRNGGFNLKVYLGWMFMAASEAMVVFFCMLGLYGQTLFTYDNGLFAMGDLTFTACVILISTKMQLIEMHNKSVVVAISVTCSIGGWFLWNIILAAMYSNNVIYNVKDGLFDRFGRNALWWLTLILVVTSCVVFELGVSALRSAFWPTDADLFQEFERDLVIRKRFEEAAAVELQQGWNRGMKKSSIELERLEAQQAAREGEVRDILRNRPDTLEEGRVTAGAGEADPPIKESTDIQEMLSRRFGSVRGE